MADKNSTQIDLESKKVLSELDHFIAKSQEKSDRCSKEIIAAKSFSIEIEASLIARNNLDQEVRAKIDKARQWLNQKIDELKTEEDSNEDKGIIVSLPVPSISNLTGSSSLAVRGDDLRFLQCLPSDPEAMASDLHNTILQGDFEQLMKTALGISADTFPGSWNPLPEATERVKAVLCEGLDKARERSFICKEALSELDKAFSNSLPSKTTDIDESEKEEDNMNAFDHSGEQGKEQAMPSKKQDGGDAEQSRKRQKLVIEEVVDSSESSKGANDPEVGLYDELI